MYDEALRTGELEEQKRVLAASYPQHWQAMIRAWRAPRHDDAVWLMFAANYLFNSGGIRWAVDPLLAGCRVPAAPHPPNVATDLSGLAFVLLTHAHGDHADQTLWRELSATSCRWVVPGHMREFFLAATAPETPHDRLITAAPGTTIVLEGIRITPFDAPHYERRPGGVSIVPETGYLIETPNGRYLLPGDIRTYEPAFLKPYAPVTAVFAHIFLGRRAALDKHPPLLRQFVEFYLDATPARIILAHLHELRRSAYECWLPHHAALVTEALAAQDASVAVTTPPLFTELRL